MKNRSFLFWILGRDDQNAPDFGFHGYAIWFYQSLTEIEMHTALEPH